MDMDIHDSMVPVPDFDLDRLLCQCIGYCITCGFRSPFCCSFGVCYFFLPSCVDYILDAGGIQGTNLRILWNCLEQSVL